MELSWDSVKVYAPPIVLIAIFVSSLMSILRRIKPLEENIHFKAWLPLLPAILGTVLGICLPPFFPAHNDAATRGFFGSRGGMNAAMLFAFGRRYVRLKASKVFGSDAKDLFGPVDEHGNTLPPSGEIVAIPKEELQRAKAEADKAKKPGG